MSCFTCEHLDEEKEECLKLNKKIYKYHGDVKLYMCPITCKHFIDTNDDIYGD